MHIYFFFHSLCEGLIEMNCAYLKEITNIRYFQILAGIPSSLLDFSPFKFEYFIDDICLQTYFTQYLTIDRQMVWSRNSKESSSRSPNLLVNLMLKIYIGNTICTHTQKINWIISQESQKNRHKITTFSETGLIQKQLLE